MSISAHFQQVSSRREGRRTKTRVGRSLTCRNEESIKVLGLQSGVGGDQRRRCVNFWEIADNISETVQDRGIVVIEGLSNGSNTNELE